MRILAPLRSFFSIVAHRSRIENEMEEELWSHIRHRAEDLQRSGMAAAEAERQARLEFGGYEHFKEDCRESLGANFFESVAQDLLYAMRLLRKSPAFTTMAILTLALGIGANTAIFGVVYAVLLRPLPYTHSEQLVFVSESKLSDGVKQAGLSYRDFKILQESGVFAGAAGVSRHDLTLTGVGDPTVVSTVGVTPEMLPILNTAPLHGRAFVSEDNQKGSGPVVLLSEALWRARFGADPKLLGTAITLDQKPFTVIGIMPARFRVPIFSANQDIWIPIVHDPLFGPWMDNRGQHWLRLIARLTDGTSLARTQSEADAVSHKLATDFPAEDAGWAIQLTPVQAALVGGVRTPLLVLLTAVGLVLLLACVNIANLLLARATARVREIALRLALGAKRGRIVRQLLTESMVLGTLGAIFGVVLAAASTRMLELLLPAQIRGLRDMALDGWVFAFALGLSLLASVAFGLVPALLNSRADVKSNLQDNAARGGTSASGPRLRNALVTAEIGLAVVLVVGAGLLGRSLLRMTAVDPGFSADHLVKAMISLPRYQYAKPQQWTAFSDELMQKVQSQPGLENSANGAPLPLVDGSVNLPFTMPDHAPLPPGTAISADFVSVSPEYFRVMGIPLLKGRGFASRDSFDAARVAIISESLARQYFRDEDPIGKRIAFGFPPDSNVIREIVGVVGNVRDAALNQEPGPMMYVPFAQSPFWGCELLVKSTLPPSAVVASIRQVVWSIDKNLPITDIATMPEVLSTSVEQPRFRTWLLGAFGLMALLLAAAGIFGVVSYSVSSRTREFGVRAALGASPALIAKMVVLEGLGLSAMGLAVGLAITLAVVRFLRSQLYGVGAYDPATFLVSAVVLLTVALLACYIPARRAMRVDPMIALRYE